MIRPHAPPHGVRSELRSIPRSKGKIRISNYNGNSHGNLNLLSYSPPPSKSSPLPAVGIVCPSHDVRCASTPTSPDAGLTGKSREMPGQNRLGLWQCQGVHCTAYACRFCLLPLTCQWRLATGHVRCGWSDQDQLMVDWWVFCLLAVLCLAFISNGWQLVSCQVQLNYRVLGLTRVQKTNSVYGFDICNYSPIA